MKHWIIRLRGYVYQFWPSSTYSPEHAQTIPTVLTKLQELAKHNEERATEALDIFDDLIECEVGVVIPHIKPMVELCIALAAEASLDDPIRIKAGTAIY